MVAIGEEFRKINHRVINNIDVGVRLNEGGILGIYHNAMCVVRGVESLEEGIMRITIGC